MKDLTDALHHQCIAAHPAYYAVKSFSNILPDDYYYSVLDFSKCQIHHQANNKAPWTYISFFNAFDSDSGWKIHISGTLDNHKEILKIVSKYAFENLISFKFATNTKSFIEINSKNISRSQSGKFVVVYPSPERFEKVIEDLYILLREYEGPYILSDKCYKDSKVVYYRYGEINPVRMRDPYGTIVTKILNDKNQLVVDRRSPFYTVPEWIKDPFTNSEQMRRSTLLSRYDIKKALHFSAQGGVYISELNGRKVVIKEARAFSALDGNKKYGTERLRDEYEKLLLLKNLVVTPQPFELIEEFGNVYLVEEFIEGFSLLSYPNRNSPLINAHEEEENYEIKSKIFYDELRKIIRAVLSAITSIHAAKIVLGDISPANIIYDRNSETARFIDLETAVYIDDIGVCMNQTLFTPGFSAKDTNLTPLQTDIYKLGLVLLRCIMPYEGIFELNSDKAFELIEMYRKNGTVPDDILSVIYELLTNQISCAEEALNHFVNSKIVFSNCSISTLEIDYKKIASEMINNFKKFLESDIHPIGSDPMAFLTNEYSLGFGITGMMLSLKESNYTLQSDEKAVFDSIVKKFMCDLYKHANKYQAGLYIGLNWVTNEAFTGISSTDKLDLFLQEL